MAATSHLLSDLTRFAGVVVAPRRRDAAFHHIEFFSLSAKRVLLIIVTPEGDVQNRILLTDKAYSSSELTQAANFLNQNYVGLTFQDIRQRVQGELRQLQESMIQLMSAAMEAGSQAMAESADDYVLSGESNLLKIEDLSSNMARLRELFELFEQRTGLVQLLDTASRGAGVKIFIGEEDRKSVV